MGDQLQDAKPFGLTERQIEVLEAVVRGGHTRAVAASLSLSDATVKRHLANIYEKMGVTSRLEAVAAGVRAGLLSPSELWETPGEDGPVELLRRKAGYGREEFVRQLLDNFPNGSVNVFDRDLRYLLAEGRGLQEEGLTSEMLVGKTVEELFPKESADFVGPFYRRAFAGENVEFELPLGSRTYGIFAAPLREEDGEVRTIIAVAQDITDRKRVQAERERLLGREQKARAAEEERKKIGRELHDRLAHTMALVHQSLQLFEAYEERGDPQKAADKLELAKRMAEVAIEQTRDLSRALRSEEAARGLEAELSELLSALVPPGMNHDLSVEGDEGAVPAEVREQLFLVLREAVRNAVSHSRAGRLSVQVRTDGERIVGVVADDGRGLDQKRREHSEAGGLAYMAERASLIGGSCSIESAPGEGTRVEASFPLGGA